MTWKCALIIDSIVIEIIFQVITALYTYAQATVLQKQSFLEL